MDQSIENNARVEAPEDDIIVLGKASVETKGGGLACPPKAWVV
ncbi:hypothetical protein BRI6_4589 [plant metagenome]|uniref:Uncharacterized protein n=1 Tax=plant metagenome TaxID=1297885 RepID=A0A484RXZ0_9ZZZZ